MGLISKGIGKLIKKKKDRNRESVISSVKMGNDEVLSPEREPYVPEENNDNY